MPDIAMCMNTDCPLKEKCYRYKAEPSEFWQSYGEFKSDDNDKCFWLMEDDNDTEDKG